MSGVVMFTSHRLHYCHRFAHFFPSFSLSLFCIISPFLPEYVHKFLCFFFFVIYLSFFRVFNGRQYNRYSACTTKKCIQNMCISSHQRRYEIGIKCSTRNEITRPHTKWLYLLSSDGFTWWPFWRHSIESRLIVTSFITLRFLITSLLPRNWNK